MSPTYNKTLFFFDKQTKEIRVSYLGENQFERIRQDKSKVVLFEWKRGMAREWYHLKKDLQRICQL